MNTNPWPEPSTGVSGPSSSASPENAPWWRHPMVWLVLAGPAAVVLAGFWTCWIAATHPDPVVGDTARAAPQAGASTKPASTSALDTALMPAQQARNHAAFAR